jgi:hypothetical protein
MLVANGPEKLSENRAPHAGAFLCSELLVNPDGNHHQ